MICTICNTHMQQDLDSQGRLEWFCLNPDCETNKSWMHEYEFGILETSKDLEAIEILEIFKDLEAIELPEIFKDPEDPKAQETK